MMKASNIALSVLAATLLAGCTTQKTDVPALAGPSALSTSVTVTATPDSVTQDGSSQAAIKVSVRDANGAGVSGKSIRLDMQYTQNGTTVNGDFGSFTNRTLVTGSDGTANSIYIAPAAQPVNPAGGSQFTTVSILATPMGSDFQASSFAFSNATIHVVPLGVIVPVGKVPVSNFTFSSNATQNVPVSFDASLSCAEPLVGGLCTSQHTITNYSWNFGDGANGGGKFVSHTYTVPGSYSVILSVTNDMGVTVQSAAQTVTVALGAAPSGDWIFSPSAPVIGDTVFFNASGVKPAPGRTITQFNWNFGDGGTATGVTAQHSFSTAAGFNVALSVVDDTGQQATITHAIVVGTGAPQVICTLSPSSPTHGVPAVLNCDGTLYQGGATAAQFVFNWNDGTAATGPQASSSASHTFPGVPPAVPYTVTVTVNVTDSKGRVGVGSVTVTVQ